MRRAGGAMDIELFFKERVDCAVQRERKSRRSPGAEPFIYIEASRALHKQIDAAPADRERLGRLGVENIARSLGVVVFGHRGEGVI